MPKVIPNRDERIKAMAAAGVHKSEIARRLDCHRSVIYDWAALWPEIKFEEGRIGQNSLRGECFTEARRKSLGLAPAEMADLKTLIQKGRYLEDEAIRIIETGRNPRRITATPTHGATA